MDARAFLNMAKVNKIALALVEKLKEKSFKNPFIF